MKLINKKNNQITFTVEIEESLANAIRRHINQIPVLAINEVEISKNDSPLYDETIAHRLGLIPLKANKTADEKKGITLKLDVKKEGVVYSGELKGNAKAVYDNIPITYLDKGKELKVTATTKTGRGEEHSKFSPGLMFYRNFVDIKIDKDCPKEIIESCPKGVLKLKEGKIIAENLKKCDECEICIEECKKRGKDSITITPTGELIITLESFGQLNVKDLFKKSVEELKKDLKKIQKKI